MNDSNRKLSLVVISAVFLIHGVLVFLLLDRHRVIIRMPAEKAMIVRALRADQKIPVEVVELPLKTSIAAPSFQISAPPADDPPRCDIGSRIEIALSHDRSTLAALAPAAAEPHRAIMIWDGRWTADAAANAAQGTVRSVIESALLPCQNETMTGTRLVFIPVGDTTISVAIGSGTWTWKSLLFDNL